MIARSKKFAAMLAALASGVVLMVGSASPTQAAAGQSYLNKGERLYNGERIWRPTAQGNNAELVMQHDGNLVLYSYGPSGRRVCWASGTNGRGGRFVEYQHDGNLVIYTADSRAVWASGRAPGDTTDISRFGQVWVGYSTLTSYCV
jgi:hypothetical protein